MICYTWNSTPVYEAGSPSCGEQTQPITPDTAALSDNAPPILLGAVLAWLFLGKKK